RVAVHRRANADRRLFKGAAPAAALADGVVAEAAMAADAAGGAPGAAPAAPPAEPAPMVQPTVRSNFADTALWIGSLTTNEKGEADVTLKMPENLTTWRVKVWGLGHGTRVGQGEADIITRKNLI